MGIRYPHALVAGDFNGDGRTDLAVANSGSNDVSVLLGNGDGTFQNQVTYAVGSYPDALVAGDFNGDGRTDLAVANYGSERRVGAAGQRRRHLPEPGHLRGGVLLHTPSWPGTSTATAAPTWPSPTTGSNDVSVLLGNGDGTFQNQVTTRWGPIHTPSWRGTSTATAAPTWPSPTPARTTCRCCWATATAPSRTRCTYAVGSAPDALVAGDFNGDGRTDLAVANYGSNDVSVLLGNGDGTFQNQVLTRWGSYPHALVAGDFNGDGRTDLAVANPTPTTCRCCWATATAPSRTRSPTRWLHTPSWPETSTEHTLSQADVHNSANCYVRRSGNSSISTANQARVYRTDDAVTATNASFTDLKWGEAVIDGTERYEKTTAAIQRWAALSAGMTTSCIRLRENRMSYT